MSTWAVKELGGSSYFLQHISFHFHALACDSRHCFFELTLLNISVLWCLKMSSKVADVWSAHTGFSIIGWIEGKIDFWLHSLLWRWEKFGRLCNGRKSTYKRQPWAARGIQMEDCIEIQNPNVIEIQVKHCCVEISMNWNGEEVVSGGWGLDGVSANSQRHPKNPLELSIRSFHCCWSSLAVPDLWSLWKLCDVPDWGYNLNQDLKHLVRVENFTHFY